MSVGFAPHRAKLVVAEEEECHSDDEPFFEAAVRDAVAKLPAKRPVGRPPAELIDGLTPRMARAMAALRAREEKALAGGRVLPKDAVEALPQVFSPRWFVGAGNEAEGVLFEEEVASLNSGCDVSNYVMDALFQFLVDACDKHEEILPSSVLTEDILATQPMQKTKWIICPLFIDGHFAFARFKFPPSTAAASTSQAIREHGLQDNTGKNKYAVYTHPSKSTDLPHGGLCVTVHVHDSLPTYRGYTRKEGEPRHVAGFTLVSMIAKRWPHVTGLRYIEEATTLQSGNGCAVEVMKNASEFLGTRIGWTRELMRYVCEEIRDHLAEPCSTQRGPMSQAIRDAEPL